MKLLLDIGNTRVKGALQSESGLKPLPPLAYADGDLIAALESWGRLEDIQACWVASVGHADICEQLSAWVMSNIGKNPRFPKSTIYACGVTNAYASPANLGVDRWLGMIAAHAQSKRPTVVVSAGTAVTIDAVDACGQHLGGLIAPGLTTQRKAMLEHTQVRADTSRDHMALLGDSTDACVTLGTLHTVLGYIERVTEKLQAGQRDWRYIIAGGDAEALMTELDSTWEYQPLLVLNGLSVLSNSED